MMRLQAKGNGSRRKQAEPLTIDEGEMLWQKQRCSQSLKHARAQPEHMCHS